MSEKEFKESLKELGIELNTKQEEQFRKFYQFLIEKNKVMNLTRIIKKDAVYLKHFYDSSTVVKIVDFNKVKTLCDVGSGAGFPGIVLKILYPELEIVLLDALQKRVNYLNELITYLGLEKIEAIHLRGEEYHKKQFDIVIARAVASLEKLVPICMPLVQENGRFIAMKANVSEEKLKAQPILEKKQIHLDKEIVFHLPKEESIHFFPIQNKVMHHKNNIKMNKGDFSK